jgi:hypothetical protein
MMLLAPTVKPSILIVPFAHMVPPVELVKSDVMVYEEVSVSPQWQVVAPPQFAAATIPAIRKTASMITREDFVSITPSTFVDYIINTYCRSSSYSLAVPTQSKLNVFGY